LIFKLHFQNLANKAFSNNYLISQMELEKTGCKQALNCSFFRLYNTSSKLSLM